MPENADHSVIYPIPLNAPSDAHIKGEAEYDRLYKESITQPKTFWSRIAKQFISWEREFDYVQQGSLLEGDVRWFVGGKVNASVQCLDRHIEAGNGDKVAFIWEGDEPGDNKKFTYHQVLREVCKIANVMKKYGVKKGDPVTIYMPMVPQLAFVMLACTRIGAPHSVVFAGFSSDALRERIVDVQSRFVFTCDEGKRGGRSIALKKCVDGSLDHKDCAFVERVFMFKRTGAAVNIDLARDVMIEEEMEGQRPFCPAESMNSEDTLFFLYTSGSTGKPKGVAHTTGGYLVFTSVTFKYIFDFKPGDIYACVADCGWITGHSYIIYGPLINGATSVMFESTPLYPDAGRYWDLVQRHKVTQFYTAPTAIRALMRHGKEPIEKYDLSSLRILGTVGEPINPEAWRWYFENIGKGKCAIVDTYWQTETGGFIVTPFPYATPMKPGSATKPFFGIELAVLNPTTGQVEPEKRGEEQEGVLCIAQPWPGITRTVHNNHERYMNTYLRPYPGYYFTGDGCTRDKDGYYWITGRVDDVLNVSGHRIGSAEIESALVAYDAVAESAAIGFPHEVKGEAIAVYVTLKQEFNFLLETDRTTLNEKDLQTLKEQELDMKKALRNQVRVHIGPFATPDLIILTNSLPKTRSGKIMRRVLRKLIQGATDAELGDVSTLADSSVITDLRAKVKEALN